MRIECAQERWGFQNKYAQVSEKARRNLEYVECKNSKLFLAALRVRWSHDMCGLRRQRII